MQDEKLEKEDIDVLQHTTRMKESHMIGLVDASGRWSSTNDDVANKPLFDRADG